MHYATVRCLLSTMVIAVLLVWSAAPTSADGFVRAWATSGNDVPIRFAVKGSRGVIPGDTVRTLRFTLQNPLPRRSIELKVTAQYTSSTDTNPRSISTTLVLDIDESARDCELTFYVINGYVMAGSLVIHGLDLHLSEDSPNVVVPIKEVPSGVVLRGQVSVYIR